MTPDEQEPSPPGPPGPYPFAPDWAKARPGPPASGAPGPAGGPPGPVGAAPGPFPDAPAPFPGAPAPSAGAPGPWTAAPWAWPPPPQALPDPVPARRRRRPLGVVAVTIAVVLALVGGVAAVAALTGPASNTPEDAVRGLFTAAGNGDVLGVLDHVDPAERDALSPFITHANADLVRLGVLAPGTDLHHIGGISATFTIAATHTDLRPGIAAVQISSGTVHTHFDASQLPLGPFVRQHAASALDKLGVKDTDTPLHITAPIVTIDRGGTWYVSIGYTIAEEARRSANLPPPDPSASVPAVGAPSAEAAVSDFINALAAVNVERMIELTPPDEMGALHDYAPLFLPKVNDALSHTKPFSITVTSLSLASASHGDGELVTIKSIGVRATFNGTTIEFTPGSKCPTVTGDASVDLSAFCHPGTNPQLSPGVNSVLGSLNGVKADVGFIAVEVNGAWYVSPTRTVLDDVQAVLDVVPSDFLTKLVGVVDPSSILGSKNLPVTSLSG
jgi:hypothetical protein